MILETAFEVTTNGAAQDLEAIEIRNPAGSGRRVRVLRVCITSGAQFSLFRLRRYAALATHGAGGDAPTQQSLYRWDLADPAPVVEVWSGEPGTHLDWSGVGAANYDHPFQLDASDAGDDDKLQPGQYLPTEQQITIEPGTSASLGLPAGSETFIVKLLLEEIPELPVAYLSSVLPDAGAWLAGGWFALPHGWTEVALHLAYTAANPAILPRPKVRVRWRAGGVTEVQQPIAGTVDTTGPPVALRLQHVLEDTINAVAAGATVTHAFVYSRLPGFDEVAFDVAELGATVTPGSIVALIAGR